MTSLYQNLDVWKKSMKLTKQIYSLTHDFPNYELYGLTSQIRRCSISIPSNIAEGSSRRTPKDFIHFFYISLGSTSELETQLILSIDLGYIKDLEKIKETQQLMIDVRMMLKKLIQSINI